MFKNACKQIVRGTTATVAATVVTNVTYTVGAHTSRGIFQPKKDTHTDKNCKSDSPIPFV